MLGLYQQLKSTVSFKIILYVQIILNKIKYYIHSDNLAKIQNIKLQRCKNSLLTIKIISTFVNFQMIIIWREKNYQFPKFDKGKLI
jgi:hypothetical protein